MQTQNSIKGKGTEKNPHIVAGAHVLVYDGARGHNVWLYVDDVRVVDGRIKLRSLPMDFYFDEALVISYLGVASNAQKGALTV